MVQHNEAREVTKMAVDIEAIKAKLKAINERGGGGGQLNAWRPDIGEHTIRCIPWPDAAPGMPFHELAFYYFGNYRILAPSQFGHNDPIKQQRDKLFATKDADDKTLAKRLLAKTRAYIPIIVRGKEQEGIKIWSVGKEIHSRLLSFFIDSDIGDYTDLDVGYDLKVTISRQAGKKFNDTSVDAARKASPALQDKQKLAALIKTIPDLKAVYRERTYDEVKRDLDAWLNAGAPEEGADGEQRGGTGAADGTPSQADATVVKPTSGPAVTPAAKQPEARQARASNTDQKLDDLASLFEKDA